MDDGDNVYENDDPTIPINDDPPNWLYMGCIGYYLETGNCELYEVEQN